MANELRDYLNSLGLKDEAVEKAVELAVPDTFRKDLAEMGGRLKDYETELSDLRPLKDAPKRKEALKRVGVDYDSQPRSVRKTFDAIPAEDLEDLDKVAEVVREEGLEASIETEQETSDRSGAENITKSLTDMGTGTPQRKSAEAAEKAFLEDLDKIPDGDREALNEVLAKHNRLQESEVQQSQ